MRHVGIDLGLRGKHQVAVFEDGRQLGQPFRLPTGRRGFDVVEERARGSVDEPIEVVMEPTGLVWLPIAAEFVRRGHQVFVPNGAKLSALRKFYSRHTKSDSVDAYTQGMVRHVDPDGTLPLKVPSASQVMLRMFVKQRARLTKEVGSIKTRIRSWLLLASPALSGALDGAKAFTVAARAFIRERLDPFEVHERGKADLEQWWSSRAQQNTDFSVVERVWRATEQTCELYGALHEAEQLPFDYELLQELIGSELDRVEHIERQVVTMDARIDALYAQADSDSALREVPGFGPAIAPTMQAFIGDVGRFRKAKAFAAYFGYVPRTNQTGGGEGSSQRMTKAGPPLAKQYLFLAAEVARHHDPELALAYKRACDGGRHHVDAVCIVAHKLLRKVYGFLTRRAKATPGTPPVQWRLVDPDTGEQLTKQAARAWIRGHCPSKAEQKRRAEQPPQPRNQVTAPEAQPSRSSEKDAATASSGTPSASVLPFRRACGQPVGSAVDELVKDLTRKFGPGADFGLDDT